MDIFAEDYFVQARHVEMNGTIIEFPRYEINAYGTIRDKETDKIVSTSLRGGHTNDSYRRVAFRSGGDDFHRQLHRVVLSSFNPVAQANAVVNHRNNKRSDNRLSNLEWATSGYNTLHAAHWHKSNG